MNMDWVQIEHVAVTATFVAAGVAMLCFLLELALKQPRFKQLGMLGMGAGLAASFVTLVARTIHSGHVPWSNLWESMILVLFATYVFYFITEFWYKPRHFGVMAAPLVLLLIGGASILPAGLKGASPLVPALQSYWIKIHTSAILVSYAAFTISFAAACAYFVFAWLAKRETAKLADDARPETGYAKEMAFFDELTYRLILVGFPLLMFGIITGAMWANAAWGTYWSWDPKETWSLITWFIYAAYLHARISRDWTGNKAAGLGVVGFMSMVVTYIGVNYLSTGLHSYGFLR